MLQIRLLGQFDVRTNGKRIVIPSRGSQSLLAFLVLTAGTAHRREKLAGMFWAEMSEDNARRNLRQELWRLRKALAAQEPTDGQVILANELTISFDPGADYWLDVAQLERPRTADNELNDQSQKLALYQGELLPGFYDDWVLLERERIHALFEAHMQALLEGLVTAERWDAVLEWGEKWLSFGDASEPAFRALMLAHATRGDMAKVTATYHRCEEALQGELGVEPSAETRALYDGLVKGAQIPARAVSAVSENNSLSESYAMGHTQRPSDDQPAAPGEPPFKGLQYFDVADAPLFFGREELTTKLLARLQDFPGLLVVIGASGSGKSSIVRAGIVPLSKNERTYIITPTAHPLEALATALTRDSESITATATLIDDLQREARALQLFLRRQYAIYHPLLVVDQFEELFTLCRDDFEREAFIDNLLYALTEPATLTLVITLRADFYAHLAQYPELRDAVARNQEYIGPMNSEELRHAMEGPAKQGHWEFEPGLVDLILRDVGDEPGALPLLSHALLETWKRRSGRTMTLKGYADAGGVRGAIAHTAEGVYEHLSPEAQHIARTIFLRLTELGEGTEDTRRRVSFDELMSPETAARSRELNQQTHAVLNLLAEARLITLNISTVEVAHEALIREWARLREWLNQDREGLRLHRHLTEAVQEWELLERDPGALYRGMRLAQAREWAAQPSDTLPRLNAAEYAFIAASIAHEAQEEQAKAEQQQRELESAKQIAEQAQKLAETEKQRAEESVRGAKKLRQRAYFLAGAFLLALVLAGLALFFGAQARGNAIAADANAQNAEREQRVATARELASAANTNLTIDPERSILLAMQAVKATAQDNTVLPEAESALHAAIQTSRVQLNLLGHKAAVHSVAVNTAGTQAVTTSEDGTAKIWDLNTGKELRSIPTNNTSNGFGISAVFTPDSTQLLTISDNNAAKLWDLKTGGLVRTLAGHSDAVGAVAVSPDGKLFATASADQTAKLWDAATGTELLTLKGHSAGIDVLTFSPDGTRLYTGSDGDGMAIAWDTRTGEKLFTFSGQGDTIGVDSIAASPDGTLIATGEFDTNVKIWDAANGNLLRTLFGHASYVDGLAFSANGKYLASSSEDGTARIWDPLTGRELLRLDGHTSGVLSVAFEPNGTHLITVSRDGTGKVWDISTEGSRDWMTLGGHTNLVVGVSYRPDGAQLATWSFDGTLKVWDAASGKLVRTIPHGTTPSGDISYSPDGKQLAFPDGDHVKIIAAANGAEILTLSPFNNGVMTLAYSPDGKQLAVASEAGDVKIYDSATGKINVAVSVGHDRIEQVAFNADGTHLVTASDDGTAHVLDSSAGKEVLTFNNIVRMSGVTYSPDGKRIATSSNDGTIKIWDATTGEIYFTLHGHTGATFGVTFSADGKQIATTSVDRTVKLWTLPEVGAQVPEPLTLLGHTASVYRAIFDPTGRRLATVSRDGTTRIYALPIQDLIEIAKSRVTRTLTNDECQKYLHEPQCPPPS